MSATDMNTYEEVSQLHDASDIDTAMATLVLVRGRRTISK